jgi:putative phage-type endonuclease
MRIVELEQQTLEWLSWRADGFGASEAAAIMGEDRYGKTKSDVLAEKVHKVEKQRNNANTRFGQRQEPVVRASYAAQTGIECRPVCIVHDTIDWLRASLDGLSTDNKIAQEIKCVNLALHTEALNGVVPRCYWVQVQHQFLVSFNDQNVPALERIDYLSYNSSRKLGDLDRFVRVKVRPDIDYCLALLAAETQANRELHVMVQCAHDLE